MKNLYLKASFMLICFLMAQTTWSQTKKITGKVVASDDGKALPGVTIVLKGKTEGTTTDVNGEFSIAATVGDNLVMSYIGYQKRK
ncbi:MAG: carboxypeptidase-like regulatory domain-containing protein [Spirosomataceae bacterium]